MKKYVVFTLVFFTLNIYNVLAQNDNWVRMMRDPSVNVHDVQKAFNKQMSENDNMTTDNDNSEENEALDIFKRWEWIMEPRTYPTGNRPNYAVIAKEYQDYLRAQNKKSGNRKATSTANWTYVGNTAVPPNIPSDGNKGGDGRVTKVHFYPGNNNIMFACTPGGGLWKTTNGGSSWSTSTDNIGDLAVNDVAINPLKPNIMYLTTGDGDGINTVGLAVTTTGVLKSYDGGNTWNATGLTYTLASSGPSYGTINNIFVNPLDTSVIVAAADWGIYRSTNSGNTWTLSQSGQFMSMAYEPSHPSIVYASTFNGKFYRSTNGGASFTQVTSGLPTSGVGRIAVAVTAADSNYVYLLVSDNSYYAFYGLYRSTNDGASFSAMSTSSGGAPNVLGRASAGNDPTVGQGFYDLSIDVSPTNKDSVVVGGINIWLSGNGGSSWTLNAQWTGSGAPYVHADIHSIEFLPGQKGAYIATCDGGVFKTTNYGASWTDLSNNLEIGQQYSMGPSGKTAGTFITGWQDNGSNLCSKGTWTQNVGGDGMVAFIDHSTDNNMYAEYPNGQFVRSTNAGANWQGITSGLTEQGPWVTVWMQDPKTSNTLFCGLNNVWKSTNQGTGWSQISTWSSAAIKALAIDSSNDNYIYAAQSGKLEYTSNGGSTWTNITGTLPVGSASISGITVNPKNPSHVWVTFSGYSSGNKVFQSYNSGASWTNISAGLPNLPVNCITYQPGTLEALYIGTDQGVYYHDSINGWVSYNTGLPNVLVSDIKVAMVNKKVLVATYGRGSWESNLFSSTAAPVAYFKASPLTICAGSKVQFTDTSTNNPTSWQWTFTGGTPASSTTKNPLVTYNTAGTYAVKLTVKNSNGSDSITKTSYIKVNAVTVPTITQSGSLLICNPSGLASYQWYLNGVAISGATHDSLNTTSNGTYKVVVDNSSGCMDSASTSVINTGINDLSMAGVLNIYPNPTTGIIEVTGHVAEGSYTLIITNILGQEVYKVDFNANGKYQQKIDMTANAKGMYFINLKSNNISLVKKILLTN